VNRCETDVIIVGSGPSAFASLAALPHNLSVTLLDVGNEPAHQTKLIAEELGSQIVLAGPNLGTLNAAFRNSFGNGSQIGDFKRFFGDGFSYDSREYGFDYSVSARASIGSGGFSTVWGATVLPFSNLDLNGMSAVQRKNLLSGYAEVSKLVNIEGDFEENNYYQNHTNSVRSFLVSPLSSKLMIRNRVNSALQMRLKSQFFSSSVMVGKSSDTRVSSCLGCGLCHVGCPFGLIWNSSNALSLLPHQKVLRLKGKAISFSETDNCVTVNYIDPTGQKQLTSRLLILTCGPISTAGVVLASNLQFQSVLISDSQTFFKHCISLRKIGELKYRNTLAEYMLAINTQGYTGLFAQLYSRSHYSDFRAKAQFAIFDKMPKFFVDAVLSRIVTTLVYLPGELSNSIRVLRDGSVISVENRLKLVPRLNKVVLLIKYSMCLLSKGIVALPFIGTKLETGGGNHIGNSRLESCEGSRTIVDPNGFLIGFSRVMVNDGSSLVRVPAGPITFSVMAAAFSTVKNLVQDHKSFSRLFG
jgi:ferredoxin